MYICENPIYADEVLYEGELNPHEVLCEIKWTLVDVMDMMAAKGIALTDANIGAVVTNSFSRVLKDRSIQEGWEIIDVLVSEAKFDELAGRV